MAKKIVPLTLLQIEKKSKNIPDWIFNKAKTQISKSFSFASYLDGLTFIARIAVHAEIFHHYPEIELTHTKVKIKLSSPEIKSLSSSDFDLAEKIDRISLR